MNLKRIAEWMHHKAKLGPDGVCYVLLHDSPKGDWHEFNPENDWRDCGPVQTKLIIEGLIQIRSNYRIAYYSFKARKDMRSQTIVTDDATLRRAIVELAGQVAEGGEMSTPRTDAAEIDLSDVVWTEFAGGRRIVVTKYVPAYKMREMERELARVTAELAECRENGDRLLDAARGKA